MLKNQFTTNDNKGLHCELTQVAARRDKLGVWGVINRPDVGFKGRNEITDSEP